MVTMPELPLLVILGVFLRAPAPGVMCLHATRAGQESSVGMIFQWKNAGLAKNSNYDKNQFSVRNIVMKYFVSGQL